MCCHTASLATRGFTMVSRRLQWVSGAALGLIPYERRDEAGELDETISDVRNPVDLLLPGDGEEHVAPTNAEGQPSVPGFHEPAHGARVDDVVHGRGGGSAHEPGGVEIVRFKL